VRTVVCTCARTPCDKRSAHNKGWISPLAMAVYRQTMS
jgi:hypothetical protein